MCLTGRISRLFPRSGLFVRPSRLFQLGETDYCLIDKEVEGYYDDGMRVPDDVILLWTDDKFVYPAFFVFLGLLSGLQLGQRPPISDSVGA